MPDYLEELLTGAEDLLEQVKRLERGLSGLTPGERAETPEEAVPASGPAADREEESRRTAASGALWAELQAGGGEYDLASRREPAQTQREAPAAGRRGREEPASPLDLERTEPEKERAWPEGPSPLLDQLERLERAALPLPPGGAGAGRESGPALDPQVSGGKGVALPGLTGPSGEGWSGGGGPDRYASPAEEELRWAERADRVFRRDSRRYDGGFYLY